MSRPADYQPVVYLEHYDRMMRRLGRVIPYVERNGDRIRRSISYEFDGELLYDGRADNNTKIWGCCPPEGVFDLVVLHGNGLEIVPFIIPTVVGLVGRS